MSGGARYWNEESQRWEAGDEAATAPATSPPPPRPDFAPPAPDGEGGGQPVEWWSARPSVPGGTGEPPGDGTRTAPEQPGGAPWSTPELSSDGSRPPADRAIPVPVAPRKYSRRLLWSVLGGAAAVGVATALVVTLVVGNGDGDTGPGTDGPAASASPTAEPSTSGTEGSEPPADETPSPSASDTDLPAGYEIYADPQGFSIALPTGWERSTVASQYGMDVVNYRSFDGERRLQVYEVAESSPDESFRLYLSDETPKPDGFEELSLQQLYDGEFPGSRLEYLADSFEGEPDVGTWHVYDERFVAADGSIYAIAAYGSDADGREDELELLETALSHFCPPYTSCGADPGLD